MNLPSMSLSLLLLAGCSAAPMAAVDANLPDRGAASDASRDDASDAGGLRPVDVPAVEEAAVVVDAGADVSPAVARIIADRPYRLVVPSANVATRAAPLVILLHGYGASGMLQEFYFRLTAEADRRGMLYAIPDGTLDASMRRFWSATDACCNFARAPVDDVAYLDAIIDDVSARYAVDPRRVFLIGHSNGGFMAHRMACARANRIAAIVSLAGATFNDAAQCAPSEPVAVLQVHGTLDGTIRYQGGTNAGVTYPSAATSVARWATTGRCAATPTDGAALDLDTGIAGAETRVARHEGCMAGAAELWSITGGTHLPSLGAQWSTLALDWLMAHPKAPR